MDSKAAKALVEQLKAGARSGNGWRRSALADTVKPLRLTKLTWTCREQVDDRILKDTGVSAAGDRLRIRNAIAKLTAAPTVEVNLSAAIAMP